MRILSLNITHDSSVCSLNNGVIEFFCKEERLSRTKRDKNPFKSLALYQSLNFGKIDHILFCTPSNYNNDVLWLYEIFLKKMFNVEMENFSSLTHHLCHASLAFFNSGFKNAITFVIDRNGSIVFQDGIDVCRESESVFNCSYPDKLEPIYKSFHVINKGAFNKDNLKNILNQLYPKAEINVNNEYSIVKVYESATTLIGQNALENGKTMGLSSYGLNKNYCSLFLKGAPISNYFNQIDLSNNLGERDNTCFYNDQDKITKNITKENYQFYANKAKHVQLETQKESLRLIKKYIKKTNIKNVCIVGGYGLNVVANNYYIKNLPNVNFYFEPLSDDTGISIGAAYYKYRNLSKDTTVHTLKNNFFHYYKDIKTDYGFTASLNDVCKLLYNNKSVAIFEGAPEAGPRALGHRSILFNPKNSNCKNIINKIKNREWYRPFAGVILEEKFNEYFHTLGLKESKYMTINFDCKEKAKNVFPGIIHVDNTCRIQTVSSGFIYNLLKKFNDMTGCPALLNTSLNLAGQPLVNTKQEALDLLNNSELDSVYFVDDKKLVLKND
jgi:carbamoyltransferase